DDLLRWHFSRCRQSKNHVIKTKTNANGYGDEQEEIVNVPEVGLPPAEPAVPAELPPTEPEVGLPAPAVSPIADGGITKVTPITPSPTKNATLSDTGELNYYNRNDGKFYRLLEDGTVVALSDEKFYNVDEATFAPNGNSAILEYPDGSNIYYDFATDRQVTLPTHWEEFDFSPQGNQIAAKSIGLDPSNRFVIVANPDGSGAVPVQELGNNADEVIVDWSPNNQIVATATTGRNFGVDRHEVYFIGQHHENFRSMTVGGLNFQPKWSPSGEQLLYSSASSTSDWKPRLWIVDAVGDDIGLNRRMINVDTWAEKCTFSDAETLYCAVPRELPRGAGLQPRIADSTPDDIIKIDLVTGLQTRVAIPEGSHTIDKIMITQDGSSLYFTGKDSGILNEIKLRH
ncbi:MAG: hypothetical protein U9Q07_08675, partial [Planctomycetota bacterium]|nr:hypothetical protein [Planctomycetota bacterium]